MCFLVFVQYRDSQAQGTWIHYFVMKPLHSHLSRTPQNFAGIHISFLPPYCTHTRAVRDELRAKPRNSVLSCTNYKGKLVEVAFIRELWRNDILLKIFKLKILETGIILYSLWVKNHTLPSFATAFNPALEQAGSCFAVSFLIARIERLLCFCFGFWRVQVPFNRKKLSLPCMHGLRSLFCPLECNCSSLFIMLTNCHCPPHEAVHRLKYRAEPLTILLAVSLWCTNRTAPWALGNTASWCPEAVLCQLRTKVLARVYDLNLQL